MQHTDETKTESPRDPSSLLPVYPDLLFKELLMILACLLVLAWAGLLFEAPLALPANPDFTPNPAKAPWYFLGIQELLIYFDPWLAGVVIPLLILSGLILVPLLDNDPEGAGAYAFRDRIWAALPFSAGLFIWVVLTVIAAFFRGPNWDWYWPWENWSMAKPARTGFTSLPIRLGGPLFALYYLLGLLLPFTLWRSRFRKWGRMRCSIYFFLILTMAAVVIKILLRLFLNLRYILQTPWFNI